MLFALIILILAILIIVFSLKMNHKTFFIVITTVTVIATGCVCVMSPKMHDVFSMNVIDYLVKFNSDGSMTTTKQITTEVLKETQK